MQTFEHISFYRFIRLDDPEALNQTLKERCEKLKLWGTILLASEGINGMLAGSSPAIQRFCEDLQRQRELMSSEPIEIKRSFCEVKPFKRLIVKVKPQIITLRGVDEKLPLRPAPYVEPKTLHEWYKNGEDFVVLDSRNDFEFRHGTFKRAVNPRLKSFSDFFSFVGEHGETLKDKKVVTFCTGGIRCEKSSALLKAAGVKEVYQLHGGILEYLAQTDGSYFEGACFVFDERISLDKNLKPVSV